MISPDVVQRSRSPSKDVLTVCAIAVLFLLWYADWLLPNIQLGPIAALPVFFLTYRLGMRAGLLLAALAATAFGLADYDVGLEPTRAFEMSVYSFGLFAAFATLAYGAGRWRANAQQIAFLRKNLSLQEYRAEHDALTNLPNRAHFERRLDHSILSASARGTPFGVLIADLDGFKAVNDSLGHVVGDALLKEIARRLSVNLRQSDTVARIGGDEFGLIVDGVAATLDLAHVCGALASAAQEPIVVDGASIRSGISFGFSRFPIDGRDRETLIRTADRRMYRAKRFKRTLSSTTTTSIPDMHESPDRESERSRTVQSPD